MTKHEKNAIRIDKLSQLPIEELRDKLSQLPKKELRKILRQLFKEKPEIYSNLFSQLEKEMLMDNPKLADRNYMNKLQEEFEGLFKDWPLITAPGEKKKRRKKKQATRDNGLKNE